MPHDDPIRVQAVAWAVRAGDPAFEDWDEFTAWLERSPAHSAAYDLVAAAAGDAAQAGALADDAVPVAATDEEARPSRWWRGAVAASLALIAMFGFWYAGDGSYAVETQPGETRMVALDDGSRIDVAGGSRILLDRDNPRFASLERGQALFTIRHDDADPFILDAGEDRLVDAGTIFDVSLSDDGLVVGVSEGVVIFNPDAQDVRLEPGDMLASRRGSREYVTSSIALEQVGEWREGRLTFRDASIASVAADLTRATGVAFAAAPGVSQEQRLSGSILVDPVRAEPASLGPLLGVSIRRSGEQWLIGMP